MGEVKAVIDIGSNSIKLRVGRFRRGRIEVLLDSTEVVRLGRGLEGGRLREETLRNGVRVVEEMVRRARDRGADPRLVGTMALRIAENAQDFLDAILDRTGLEATVLSGEEEARLAWKGAVAGRDCGGAFAVFDTGGGSTEFIFGSSSGIERSESVAVGAVSLSERFFAEDPVSEASLHEALGYVRDLFFCSKIEWGRSLVSPTVIGLGGGLVAMASVRLGRPVFVPLRLDGMRLSRENVEEQVRCYAGCTLDERRRIVGLPASRADLVLGSACIVRCAMEALHVDSLIVGINGLRHGLLVELFEADGFVLR